MKLLFDKDGQDPSDEMKELLGFIDADINFRKVKPDVITATNDLVQLIGTTMYDAVVETYLGDEAEDEEQQQAQEYLVYVTRYPVAINAYMLFAPNNDLAHTNNGRKMRQDDNEKLPFEWMIEKDNEAMAKRYYRALDDMLRHFETLDSWKVTHAYKALHKLFITTTDQFDEFFHIGNRYILLKLAPGIRQCEEREIKPRVGKERYDALKTKLQAATDLEDDEKDLLQLIREACVFHSMAWAMTRLSVSIFPEGILQAYTSDRDTVQIKRPAQKLEAQAVRQAFQEDANAVFLKIEEFVKPAETISPPDGHWENGNWHFDIGDKHLSL